MITTRRAPGGDHGHERLLTPRRQKILDFIRQSAGCRGYPPSMREIAGRARHVYPVRKCPLDPYGDRVASNLACIGLAVSDGTELGQLVTAAHRSTRQIGVYDGVYVARWQDDSGAALILGWRSGELLDLIPAYTAASGGLLSGCHLTNESVASAAVVDAEGEQLTAMAFDAGSSRPSGSLSAAPPGSPPWVPPS
jgi:hypothetical protein